MNSVVLITCCCRRVFRYIDRTWHIHIRVHFNIVPDADGQGYTGGTTSHIGQLYITDDYIEQLMTIEPYASSTVPYTSLRTDLIFNGQGGDFGLMDVSSVNDILAPFAQ